ncbi:S1 RNA-binding domain-containing protein [Marvinbryantia formatexigens]|nr:S1-like domain-containing RNA-binding protein [Marvinbryantia formatexigens]UWO23694.1 S1-like domain-containing RNA-binding protein [Marvinbryantia formatexigens DSM 14469]SDF66706.1 hypothetical protein SAMN05660368_01085 [Marvinbryantia formatexigens]
MLELGKKQILTILKETDFGVYLGEKENPQERVLLPKKEVPEEAATGDTLEVFLYKDSKDRLIATRREPAMTLGGVAVVKVAQVASIGAFLEWGLEKDLLLPFREQTAKVQAGQSCLAALYIDKSGRLCATMNVYPYLRTDSPYKKDDHVTGTIYQISEEFGVFVAVDNCYSGLIPRKEAAGHFRIGDTIQARVTEVKEDGKLSLSAREKAYLQMDEDAENIMQIIEGYDGVLPFNDKASPEVIKREFGLSKNAFKRGVGRLLKEGRVEITEKSIRKIK